MRKRERYSIIRLSPHGEEVLVDPEDAPRLRCHSWSRSGKCAAARIAYKLVLMHRYIIDAQPGTQVDHINGNPLDNRKRNLRFATAAQNAANVARHTDSNQPYKGIYQTGAGYTAKIQNKYLGTFATAEEAAVAYNRAARETFGEFARLNPFDLEEEAVILPEDAPYKQRIGTSRYRGVSHSGYHSSRPWRASIRVAGRNYYLGSFSTERAAARAYGRAVIRLRPHRLFNARGRPEQLNGEVH